MRDIPQYQRISLARETVKPGEKATYEGVGLLLLMDETLNHMTEFALLELWPDIQQVTAV